MTDVHIVEDFLSNEELSNALYFIKNLQAFQKVIE